MHQGIDPSLYQVINAPFRQCMNPPIHQRINVLLQHCIDVSTEEHDSTVQLIPVRIEIEIVNSTLKDKREK